MPIALLWLFSLGTEQAERMELKNANMKPAVLEMILACPLHYSCCKIMMQVGQHLAASL